MKNLLIVDDDQDILALLKHTLVRDFNLIFSSSLEEAKRVLAEESIEIIILDENLPDGSGSDFCAYLKGKKQYQSIPIIMLTQMTGLKDKLNAFDAGADDYIGKPFEPLEVLARVNARARVAESIGANLMKVEDLKLDITSQKLFYSNENKVDEEISLTPIEFKILYNLAMEVGKALSRTEILEAVWGKNQQVIDRTVDQHVSKVRRKLGPTSMTVKSMHKRGYLLAKK